MTRIRAFRLSSILALVSIIVMLSIFAACTQQVSPTGDQSTVTKTTTLTTTVAAAQTKPDYVWDLASGQAPVALASRAKALFAELVNVRTNGKVQVNVQYGGVLGKATDVVNMVQAGTVAMECAPTAYSSHLVPWLEILDTPFIWPSVLDNWQDWDTWLGDEVDKALQANGIKMLSGGSLGANSFVSTKGPIEKPEDLKGLHYRAQPSDLMEKYIETWGAIPVVTDFTGIYSGFEAGQLDVYAYSFNSAISNKFTEVIDYYTLSQVVFNEGPLKMNKKLFDSMPADIQQVLLDAANIQAAWLRQENWKMEMEAVDQLKQMGKTVVILTPDQLAAFKDLTVPVYQWAADNYGPEGKTILEQITGQGY